MNQTPMNGLLTLATARAQMSLPAQGIDPLFIK
jgi:hypothetical protein